MKSKLNAIGYLKRKADKDLIFRIFLYSTLIFIPLIIVLEAIVLIARPSSFNVMGIAVSLYANMCLYLFIAAAFRKAGVSYDRKSIAIVAISIAAAIAIFLYSMLTRSFLYFWDYTTYYSRTLDYFSEYSKGFIRGSGFVWVSSVWDYSWFISLITAFFLSLTNGSADSYCFSLAFSVIIPFAIALSGLIIKLSDIKVLDDKRKQIALLVSMLSILNTPSLLFNIYRSMPDVFGLSFAAVLMLLMADYSFEEKDAERSFYLWSVTVLLVYTRRWYAFYAVSFWLAAAIYITVQSLFKKNIKQFRNLIVFGISSVVGACLFLAPMVYRFLGKDYAADYASWKNDTILHNFISYYHHIGLIIAIAVLAGYILTLISDKKLRLSSTVGLVSFYLPLMLFHIIQTADHHQLLILAPSMTLGLILFVIAALRAAYGAILVAILSIASFLNIAGAFYSPIRPDSKLFSDIDLNLPYRNDLEEIDYINAFIKEHCNSYGDVYMIPHNGTYCPDIFRWRAMPDRAVMDILPYGSDVTSAHEFPKEIFTAHYVITSNIRPIGEYDGSNADHIDRVVTELTEEGYYKVLETVDMANGYTLTILERIKASDEHETELYRAELKENIESYPHLYEALK